MKATAAHRYGVRITLAGFTAMFAVAVSSLAIATFQSVNRKDLPQFLEARHIAVRAVGDTTVTFDIAFVAPPKSNGIARWQPQLDLEIRDLTNRVGVVPLRFREFSAGRVSIAKDKTSPVYLFSFEVAQKYLQQSRITIYDSFERAPFATTGGYDEIMLRDLFDLSSKQSKLVE